MENNIVNVEFLAQFFKKDVRTIQLWSQISEDNKNPMPKIERGKYDFIECVRWRIERLEEQLYIAENSGDEKLHGLKVEGQRISNKERMLKLRKMMMELVPYDSARLAWLNETTIFRKNLLAVVPKICTAMESLAPGHTTKIRQMVSEHIHDVLFGLGELRVDMDNDNDIEANSEQVDDEID